MAIADAVPGVSGGTIGFILGFYERFITSLHNILSRDKKKRIDAIKYLAKLLTGWVVGFIISMLLLKTLFEKHVYVMCSAFIGLTVAAIPFIIITEIKCIKGKYYNLIWTLIGAGLVVGITMLKTNINISFVNGLSGWEYLYVFVTGFVSISAMILPGLSGSTVMLIMGVYIPAIAAAHEALHFNITWKMILGLLPMGIGLITGILLSVKGIKIAIERHRSPTIYCVLGMTAASVYAIMMAPPSVDAKAAADAAGEAVTTHLPMTLIPGKENSLNIIAFVLGAALIVALEIIRLRIEKRARLNEAGDVELINEAEEAQTEAAETVEAPEAGEMTEETETAEVNEATEANEAAEANEATEAVIDAMQKDEN